MKNDVKFFYDEAGYSVERGETPEQGRSRCAKALAAAKREAGRREWYFNWSPDQNGDEPNQWICVLYSDSGEDLASMGGIDFENDGEPWGQPYKRVVEAQLALEAIDKAE